MLSAFLWLRGHKYMGELPVAAGSIPARRRSSSHTYHRARSRVKRKNKETRGAFDASDGWRGSALGLLPRVGDDPLIELSGYIPLLAVQCEANAILLALVSASGEVILGALRASLVSNSY